MPADCTVTANYIRTPPELRRYFAGIFLIEIAVEDGQYVEDFMFPDWATLRFNQQPVLAGTTRDGSEIAMSTFAVSGPRSQEAYLRTGSLRQWGVLVHPLGWALLVGADAGDYSNRLVDGFVDPVFERFRPLAETLFDDERDPDGELQRLVNFFSRLTTIEEPAEEAIARVSDALRDPEVDCVATLAERARISRRTLERLCGRTFGFSPKTLLRRQRFMRSLTHFTVDPSLKWVGALDASYHDQAQFVRDFRHFMGMTPTEYGQRPKPVVEPVIVERVRYARALLEEKARSKAA